MKTIFLVRHAEAVTGSDTKQPDIERPLAKQGMADAKKIGMLLKQENILPDLMLSSPARRALETAHAFSHELGIPIQNIFLNRNLYDGSVRAILKSLKDIDDSYSSLMLFGHDPSISDLTRFFLKLFPENFPKCGVVGLDFEKDQWKDLRKGQGRLRLFYFPEQITQKQKYWITTRQKLTELVRGKLEATMTELEFGLNDADRAALDVISAKTAKQLVRLLKASNPMM